MDSRKNYIRIRKYAPLGIDLSKEMTIFALAMIAAFIYSLIYIGRYLTNRNQLYEIVGTKKVLIDGAKMPSFDILFDGSLLGFVLVGIVMVGLVVYHYYYHRMDSKSIYLMKRLPNKWELHKRCLSLPIVGIVISIITMVLLWAVYFGIYMLFTPQQCFPF